MHSDDLKENEQMQSASRFRRLKFSCTRVEENCVTQCLVFSSFRSLCCGARQTCLREQENGEQHVTDLCTTVDSMLHLHRTLMLCFWCLSLLRMQVVADEETGWGPTAPSVQEPEKKTSWFWPTLPKLPSFPSSLSIPIPFYGSSDRNHKDPVSTTTANELTEAPETTTGRLQYAGSGEVNKSEASKPLLSSVTKIRTESPPTGTSDFPQSSTAQSDNDTLVSDSYSHTSSSITDTLFTNDPTSTNAPEQNATHTRPPSSTASAAGPSMGVPSRHLPEDKEKISTTTAPETTVPTALTWAEAQTTTTKPTPVEATLNGRRSPVHVTPALILETTFIRKPHDSTDGLTLQPGEATVTQTHPSQSEAHLGFSEARTGPVEERPAVTTTATVINHKLVLESTASTTQGQRVTFPMAGGKQVKQINNNWIDPM